MEVYKVVIKHNYTGNIVTKTFNGKDSVTQAVCFVEEHKDFNVVSCEAINNF
jgi:hypothetical protein